MAELLSSADWAKYGQAIHDAMDSFGKQVITWRRFTAGLDINGEDPLITYSDISLNGLIAYNYFRSWPITIPTSTGELDKENMVIILDKAYLASLGYMNSSGNFIYQPSEDRFIVNGVTYKDAGNTDVAQERSTPLLMFIICKKEEIPTGSRVNPLT